MKTPSFMFAATVLTVFLQTGIAFGELKPKTQALIKRYQELVDKAPWGVGSKDLDTAGALLKDAKAAEKEAPNLDMAELQRVQGMTNFMMALEYAKVGGRGWKFNFTKRMTYAGKDASDLKKAHKKDPETVGPVWDSVKKDFTGIQARYVQVLKDKGKDLKEKLDKLQELITKSKD